jgi:hypothetical protein
MPPQGWPLRVQPSGEPEPLPRNPKDVDAPGASVPFQERLVNVYRCPDDVMSASQ